ncbi:hypothetical protein SGGMMB4_01818 [Sodalis glossinidius str. 'morsitans']|uniref:Uncharacterized protein n=1 Tax=Sodalis glossinidius (strain morsitans) TaxID=343509 RepID=A0A193QHH7_SODGM|nr:hypothetical protein SGGMMB4_01818 [Sodalis glossinidius str. 'morsitans']
MVLCRQATYILFNFPLTRSAANSAGIDTPKVLNRVDLKTLELSYYNEPEATFGSRHGQLKTQRITYTAEQEKTVVSKEYL